MKNNFFHIHSIKGKLITAFLLGCVAFIFAWDTSKGAFQQILNTLELISAPNQRLRIVNELYRDINGLDQLQKSAAFRKEDSHSRHFLNHSKALRQKMDSLHSLYPKDSQQVSRIDSMKQILKQRDSLFIDYIRLRNGLVNSESFSKQLDSLAALIDKSSSESDSSVITTEQRKLITTIIAGETRERSFFGRLFGKKKEETGSKEVITEEVKIKIDTLSRAAQEKLLVQIDQRIKNLEAKRKRQSSSFVQQEQKLMQAGNVLVSQMLLILQKVENEVIRQSELNNLQAKSVVSASLAQIGKIMLAFMLVTAILLYFILTDLTKSNEYRKDLELAKEEAELHSAAKQRFLSSMSHEIRTPLQSIIGYSELVKNQAQPDKKSIDVIYQSSLHLLHIVNEMLDFSRIISGKFKFEKRVFNMSELVDEVILIMKPQAESKSLKLNFSADLLPQSHQIEGDDFRLRQILFNLLGNAIKFTDEGEVSLSVSSEQKEGRLYFTFCIEDTGCGIDPGNIQNIFNEFEQGSVLQSQSGGTGLGLSIVKALTEGQGGTIHAESEPGKGSRFVIKLKYGLPRKRANGNSRVGMPQVKSAGEVWVVDDDPFILQLCSAFFRKHQIVHTCFHTPQDLLNEPINDKVGVVLTDIRMPGMDGKALCQLLRKKMRREVKMYAITAQVLPEEREEILKLGFDGLLMKPFRESELLGILSDLNLHPEPNGKTEKFVHQINLTDLEKMVGDRALVKKVLHRFVEDTEHDIRQIQDKTNYANTEEISLLLHRIAGRTSQMGASQLAAKFRKEELVLRQNNLIGDEQQLKIMAYSKDLEDLIRAVQKQLQQEDYSI